MAMAKGNEGEKELSKLLREHGWEIRKLDYFGRSPQDKWYMIEIKNKEPWEPPPTYQQGLWLYQYTFYKQIHYLFGIRTILIVKGQNNKWLAQYLNLLEVNNYRKLNDGKEYAFFNLAQFKPLEEFQKCVCATKNE